MDLRSLMQKRPKTFYLTVSSLSAAFGLGLSPSLGPLSVLIAILLLYAPILYHRFRQHRIANIFMLWLSLALFGSVGRLSPTLTALSTAGPSIAVLLGLNCVTSALSISAIFADIFIRSRTGWSQTTLFPAIWTTLWAATAYSPLGRLSAWSPILSTGSYAWMAPWVGMLGIDWVAASWAVVISRNIGAWFMGQPDSELELEREHVNSKSRSTLASTWTLLGVLTALTIPSYIISNVPHSVSPSESTTPLVVGCALPSPAFSRYNVTSFGLDEYIHASKTMDPARIILWPEGAVSFKDENEKTEAFERIAFEIGRAGTYWAVSFDEKIRDPSNPKKRIQRTGLAIISNQTATPHVEYYKRSLVPIAESFRFIPGTAPPPLFELQLPVPKGVSKATWGKRPIDLTASICMDFTMPSVFDTLPSRPTLILAPGNTWDRAIGSRMWEEVKQRANEVGSIALWCDGGEGGMSGVVGGGYNDIYQMGEGSWIRTIGLPHPYDTTPTFYARFGGFPALLLGWALVGAAILPWSLALLHYKKSHPHRLSLQAAAWVHSRITGQTARIEQPVEPTNSAIREARLIEV
ncbi:Apolipoprotein n-acyltransferase [Mycena indigotica]|uniref:Apolipoprotein n-acyltransferase n=1 Tax=Mycena indigotica TaxID=2126181 RepID=A0A8H6SYT4_9AGAR|nr:Apolipoprotein n-acyltransferase [Mycena indigotica]KAF7307136.1 Apolipoprotein n-acyltransferase [Mycena indigotica]